MDIPTKDLEIATEAGGPSHSPKNGSSTPTRMPPETSDQGLFPYNCTAKCLGVDDIDEEFFTDPTGWSSLGREPSLNSEDNSTLDRDMWVSDNLLKTLFAVGVKMQYTGALYRPDWYEKETMKSDMAVAQQRLARWEQEGDQMKQMMNSELEALHPGKFRKLEALILTWQRRVMAEKALMGEIKLEQCRWRYYGPIICSVFQTRLPIGAMSGAEWRAVFDSTNRPEGSEGITALAQIELEDALDEHLTLQLGGSKILPEDIALGQRVLIYLSARDDRRRLRGVIKTLTSFRLETDE
ncbi:hypothetical protein BU16DRAFT_561740 [Lophium mytilinum]|uniref:Uncharacterized protein n=1 Tax=Lophium mytilinum TaxID=390894 RepID=A0A6A6QWS0_9PEZI|nr:hypothetical protein BU16DRAFT_561740 [Lophium mytilinum]